MTLDESLFCFSLLLLNIPFMYYYFVSLSLSDSFGSPIPYLFFSLVFYKRWKPTDTELGPIRVVSGCIGDGSIA